VASQRLKKVIGVELDKEIYAIAQKNLYNLRINKTHIELLNIDAVNFDVKEVTIFYMFNPFGYKTLEKVLNNIRESLVINPRNIRIVYYGPIFGHLLDKQNWLIREGKIEDDNCLVWRSKQ
jgi:predicted RNA methylase